MQTAVIGEDNRFGSLGHIGNQLRNCIAILIAIDLTLLVDSHRGLVLVVEGHGEEGGSLYGFGFCGAAPLADAVFIGAQDRLAVEEGLSGLGKFAALTGLVVFRSALAGGFGLQELAIRNSSVIGMGVVSLHNSLDHIANRSLRLDVHGEIAVADINVFRIPVTDGLVSIGGIAFAVDLPVGDHGAEVVSTDLENHIIRSSQGQGGLLTSFRNNLIVLVTLGDVRHAGIDVTGVVGQVEGNGNVRVFHDLLNTNDGDLNIFGDGGDRDVSGLGGNGLAVDLHSKVLSSFVSFQDGDIEGVAVGSDGLAGDGVANAILRHRQDGEILAVAQLVGQGEGLFAAVGHADGDLLAVLVIQVDQTHDSGRAVGGSLLQSQTHGDLAVLLGLAVAVLGNAVKAAHAGLDIAEAVHIGNILGIGDVQGRSAVGDLHLVEAVHLGDGDGIALVGEHVGELGALRNGSALGTAEVADAVHIAVSGGGGVVAGVSVAAGTLVLGIASGGAGGRNHCLHMAALVGDGQALQGGLVDGHGNIGLIGLFQLKIRPIRLQADLSIAVFQNGEVGHTDLAVGGLVGFHANHDGTGFLIVDRCIGCFCHTGIQIFFAVFLISGIAVKPDNVICPGQLPLQCRKAGIVFQIGGNGEGIADLQCGGILHAGFKIDACRFIGKCAHRDHTYDHDNCKE